LLYSWTLDGAAVGTDSASFTLNGSDYSIGDHQLKLTINDSAGQASQEWAVKVNGSPVLSSSIPSPTTVYLRKTVAQDYTVTMTDPNSDTLTYVWKLDGQENVLTSTTATATWTPASSELGTHIVSVDVYDGPISDTGTYKVTRTWTTYVNNFSNSCNAMENNSSTNKSCVLVGISGIGDGLNPLTAASSFYIRPAALALTAANDLFIADDANHVVWFYNRGTSPNVTVLGVTVPVNTMKVVAGIGMASSGNSASTKALRNFLNTPHGIAWDGSNLYISDTSNNRVLKVDNNGDISAVLSAGCSSPRGVVVVGTTLYVACYSSNIVRSVDLTTLVSSVFAGTGAAGNPANLNESSFTDATNGKLNGPYGITADSSGNIYVGEHTGCRIHMYNLSGGPITLYGSYTISNNNQRVILGAAGAPSCALTTGEPVNLTGATDARTSNVRNLSFSPSGLLIYGTDADTVSAINFSSSATTFFGVAIGAYEAKSMIGSGTAGYIGEGQTPALTRFNNVFHAVVDTSSGDMFVADNANLRLRMVRASDSLTELIAGNGSTRAQTNAGQGTLDAGLEKMNGVRGLAIDSVSGEIFIADQSNHRIRVVNRSGQVTQAVGTGSAGSGAEEDEYPSNVTMNQPRGLTLTHSTSSYGGHLVWADSQNHRIRIYNRSSTDQTLFGVSVSAGKVATIGGNGSSGNATSGSALQAAFNQPGGVAFDGTDLYVSDTGNHCIKKIDSTGTLSAVAGTCGVSGNVNGAVGVGRMSAPEGIDYYQNGSHKGIVIAARGNSRLRFYRIAGPSLLFGGSISIGDTNSIACGGTFHTENINANLAVCSNIYDVATVGTSVCFTNFAYHNARCVSASGEITTILGGPQGIDDTTNLYGPGGTYSSEDFDSASPNYNSQNGVQAMLMPSPLTAEPALTDSYGQVSFPMSIRPLDSQTVLVGEYYLGFIRKVKLP
jgi:hypothetical protein